MGLFYTELHGDFFEEDCVERDAQRRFTFLFFCHGLKDCDDFLIEVIKGKSY